MVGKILMDGEPLGVGNDVYSLMMGIGKIIRIDDDEYPIVVCFDDAGIISFTRDFKITKFYINRDLYWRRPETIPPPERKKKVKVWDWFVEWPNGDTNKMCGVTEQYARNGVKIAQKIDGTGREVER